MGGILELGIRLEGILEPGFKFGGILEHGKTKNITRIETLTKVQRIKVWNVWK